MSFMFYVAGPETGRSPQPRHRIIGTLDDDRPVAEALAFAAARHHGGQE